MSKRAEPPIISIRGENVGLGPFDRSIIPLQTAWINIWPTTRTLGRDAHPRTLSEHDRWYEQVSMSDDRVTFAIYDLTDMAPVGHVGVFDINRHSGTCELGLGIMAPDRRGRGLGTEATRLMTDFAFRDIGMHNVHLATLEFNRAGIRTYLKAGFREYGRRRQAWLHNGRRWDMIFMDVLASEWDSPAMEVMLAPDAPRDTSAE